MLSQETSTIENLIMQAGGCGMFQVLFVMAILSSYTPIAWSGMFMAYGNYNPGWTCLDHVNNTITVLHNGSTLANVTNENSNASSDESCDAFERCQRVQFKTDMTTIVSEWGLVCSRAWVPSIIISLQMVGILIGSYSGGLFADWWGRKCALYGAVLLNGGLSLAAAFSVNWQMFAALKLIMGLMTGACITIFTALIVEFVPIRWRSITITIPIWAIGSLVFYISAMIVRDWKNLHIVNCVLSVTLSISAFWAPESMRWLATKNRLSKARNVAQKVAKTNRKPLPDLAALEIISQTKRFDQYEKAVQKYGVLDLFEKSLLHRTLILPFVWFSLVVVFYGIIFSVKALSGNIFINLISFALISIATYPVTPPIANHMGRKLGILLFFTLCAACCMSIVLLQFVAPPDVQGRSITVLALLTYCFIDASWNIVIVYTLELFPTVVRGVGYGFVSGFARLGGIVAPYLIPNDPSTLYISYIVLGALVAISAVLILTLPETKRSPLQDNIRFQESQAMTSPSSDDVENE